MFAEWLDLGHQLQPAYHHGTPTVDMVSIALIELLFTECQDYSQHNYLVSAEGFSEHLQVLGSEKLDWG